jgi:excisionase family DNA binding protein
MPVHPANNMIPEPPHGPTPQLENLWTTKQAAEFLHVSTKTIFVLRRKRGLPYIKLGGAVRFVPEEIRKYLDYSRRLSAHRLRQIARKRPPA